MLGLFVLVAACRDAEVTGPASAEPSAFFGPSRTLADPTLQAANVWTNVAVLPAPRSDLEAGLLGGKIYAVGGIEATGTVATVTVYDPATNIWTPAAPLPRALNAISGATGLGAFLYVAGGWDGSAFVNTLYAYDPATNTWTPKQPMPVAGGCGGSAALNGFLYVAIGCIGAASSNKLFRYDPVADSWLPLTSAPQNHQTSSFYVLGTKLVWSGGGSGTGSDVDIYDPASNTWTTAPLHVTARIGQAGGVIDGALYEAGGYTTSIIASAEYMDLLGARWIPRASLPLGVGSPGSVVYNNRLYVIGGEAAGGGLTDRVQVYTSGDYWLTKPSGSVARAYASAAAISGVAYVAGGRPGSSTVPMTTNEQYDPATDTWTARAPLPLPRWGAAGVAANGRFYVIGGFDGAAPATATNSVFEYTPATNTWTQKGPAPVPMGYASAAFFAGKVYVLVGTTGVGTSGQIAYLYDPVGDTWAPLPQSPRGHSQGLAAGAGTTVGFVGGSGATGLANVPNGFKPSTGNWVTGPQMPTPVNAPSGGLIGARLYVVGGIDATGAVRSTIRIFDNATTSWLTGGTPSPVSFGAAASAVLAGRVYRFGGLTSATTATAVASVYTP